MDIRWNETKNHRLIQMRGVGFQDLLDYGDVILIGKNPLRKDQWFIFVWYERYIWVIPFVRDPEGVFLKTFYPSRKYTKRFLKGEYDV